MGPKKAALVLTGGGARGAYQAGVIRALFELSLSLKKEFPFQILTGVSAGAINACALASWAENLETGTEKLCNLWRGLTPDQVFETGAMNLGRIGAQWLKGLSLGGMFEHGAPRALLDTGPLRNLLKNNVDFVAIRTNIQRKILESVSVTATDYLANHSVSFYESQILHNPWSRMRRIGKPSELSVEHVMASAAIPLFFPPIGLEKGYFGDGCVRNNAPMSTAIHLGAEKIVVIGVRRMSPADREKRAATLEPSLARILGVLLNAVFLDAVDIDIERLNRINHTVSHLTEDGRKNVTLKSISALAIQPTEDLGLLARDHSAHLPSLISYLLKGMGTMDEASEIVSYLLFEKSYCSRLVDLGYHDGYLLRDRFQDWINL